MEHPDFIVCSFMEISIGLKRVKVLKQRRNINGALTVSRAFLFEESIDMLREFPITVI